MLRDFGKNETLSLVILYIGILFLLAAPCAFADTDDLTEDIQNSNMWPSVTCQNSAIGIFADVDNADNGGTYGIYDTMLVMININGEIYGYVELPSNKLFFFTFFETNCGEPNCSIDNTCDKGRFVMRFVDMTAAGFVPDNSSTWTYKTIPSLTFYMSNDGCYDYDDPRYDTVDPYMQARAYKVVNNAIPANLIDVNATQTDVFTYDFTDADDGIAEVYITTDHCENILDDLILRSGEELICSETEGDLDGDCDVDMDDVTIFLSVLGTSAGEPAYNVCADIDGDGRVTMNDYRFMRTLFTGPGSGCP